MFLTKKKWTLHPCLNILFVMIIITVQCLYITVGRTLISSGTGRIPCPVKTKLKSFGTDGAVVTSGIVVRIKFFDVTNDVVIST